MFKRFANPIKREKHWYLINLFNDIKPKIIKGPVAQLVRAVHS